MMSILTGMVLMVGIGTVVQKSDRLAVWLGAAPAGRLVADDVQVRAGERAVLDVLANDLEVGDGAEERLVVTAEPICGRASVRNGVIEYLADETCVGAHGFAYGLRGSGATPADVNLVVMEPDRTPQVATAAAAPDRRAEPEAEVQAPRQEPVVARSVPDAAPWQAARAEADFRVAGRSAGAAVSAPAPSALPSPAAAARAPEAAGPPPRTRANATVPGAVAPAAVRSEAPAVGGTDSVVPSSDFPPVGSAAPAAIRPAAPAGGVGRLPATVVPHTDVAGLDVPDMRTSDRPRGVAVSGFRPVPRPRAGAAGSAMAPEPARADIAAGPAVAPRPGSASQPGAPGMPEIDEGIELAAAPATAPRPSAGVPASPILPRSIGGTAKVPDRREADPLHADPLEEAAPRRGLLPPGLAAAAIGGAPEAVRHEQGLAVGRAPVEPTAPAGANRPAPGLARSAVPLPSAEPETGTPPAVDLASGQDGVGRAEPPMIAAAADERVALAEPASGLGPVRSLGEALRLAPVDTAEPPPLEDPALGPDDALSRREDAGVARPAPPAEAPHATGEPAAAEPSAGEKVAALSPADAACAMPPGVSIDPGRAAITRVDVTSPCHAGTAAVLDYGAMSIGLVLGADGKGGLEVPGFESSTEASLTFADGTRLDFTLPFREVERIERVALVWDLPVALDLHAREFGADAGTPGHVRPDNPRSLDEVRRSGGGFLHDIAPVDGAGRHARVYTYYLRRGGPTGVVDMAIDFASRREGALDTCGDGALASPGFTVIRTVRGMTEQPTRARLAARDCGRSAEGSREMIANAVEDLVITY